MADKYKNFKELSLNESEYSIAFNTINSSVLIASIHGGGIEGSTTEICKLISGMKYMYYNFSGKKNGGIDKSNSDLHISSNRFDEPILEELLLKVNLAVSIHGCSDKEEITFIGGKNKKAIFEINNELILAGFNSTDNVRPSIAGTNDNNFINRTLNKDGGVQLEISQKLRDLFFINWRKRNGRIIKNKIIYEYVSSIQRGIENYLKNL